MRAVRYLEHGDAEVPRVADVARPTPEPDEILVEVKAAGVNPRDTYPRGGIRQTAAVGWAFTNRRIFR